MLISTTTGVVRYNLSNKTLDNRQYNDVNYLDSLNWQQDFLQFKVYGVVYDFS